jgi:hypothetical protein
MDVITSVFANAEVLRVKIRPPSGDDPRWWHRVHFRVDGHYRVVQSVGETEAESFFGLRDAAERLRAKLAGDEPLPF